MIVFKINVNVKYIAHIQVHILPCPIVPNRVFSPHFGLGRSSHFTCHSFKAWPFPPLNSSRVLK